MGIGLIPLKGEAFGGIKTGGVEAGAECAVAAEDDVALAGVPVIAGADRSRRADQQIREAVAVEVADPRKAVAELVKRVDAVDNEAVCAVQG